MFGLRSEMTRSIKTNFFNDKDYSRQLWTCFSCREKIDSIIHAKNGNFYAHLRQKYDNLDQDDQLVEYFKEVLKMRDEIQEE